MERTQQESISGSPEVAASRPGSRKAPVGPLSLVALALVALTLSGGGSSAAGAGSPQAGAGPIDPASFAPPRIAVVDISQVFDGYDKKKDSQQVLEKKMDDLKGRLSTMEKDYERLSQDLLKLKEDSPVYIEKNLEKKELELKVLQLKNTELKQLRETQLEYLKEIRDEIQQEIEAFAQAHDIDLVFERQVTAENEGTGVGFRWPIVHYSRPTLDITGELIRRLNTNYKKKS